MHDGGPSKRYEVAARRGGRWVIDCLARSEPEARNRAEELYADESIEAVRIVRGHFGRDGTSFETMIFERVREARRGEAPVKVGAAPSDEAWCETLADFYGPASRRAIARLLRNFLDRHSITPTELLHHHRYIRLLDRQETLSSQALQRMAALQARARGVDARSRSDALNRLVDEATAKARDAIASRAAPRLGDGGLPALAEEIAAKACSAADQAFYTRFAVSCAFENFPDPAEKLAMVLGWAGDPKGVDIALIDELVAGLLGAATLIQDAIGPQAHLAAALGELAGLAQGLATDKAPAPIKTVAGLIAASPMPETRLALVERIAREIASEKPLSRDDMVVQRRMFDGLCDMLTDKQGLFIGGPPMVDAIAQRSRRLEIVGGVVSVRFQASDPAARIEQILALATGVLSDRQQRALATYLVSLIEGYAGDPALLLALRPKIQAARLSDTAKAAALERLPRLPARAAG
ncbi:MAG TPA: hypothetical protein VN802_08705 [Stellaceae bacterium]|nr:hypothetical protein [Stellaceae bacterium]